MNKFYKATELGYKKYPSASAEAHYAFAEAVEFLMAEGHQEEVTTLRAAWVTIPARKRNWERLNFSQAVEACEEACYGPLTVKMVLEVVDYFHHLEIFSRSSTEDLETARQVLQACSLQKIFGFGPQGPCERNLPAAAYVALEAAARFVAHNLEPVVTSHFEGGYGIDVCSFSREGKRFTVVATCGYTCAEAHMTGEVRDGELQSWQLTGLTCSRRGYKVTVGGEERIFSLGEEPSERFKPGFRQVMAEGRFVEGEPLVETEK